MNLTRGCTTLDHVYPGTVPGTPCYCGKRTWAGAPKITLTLKVGTPVLVLGARRVITEKLRGEPVYRVDTPVNGRALFDREELRAV
jgi:hypothetical protein